MNKRTRREQRIRLCALQLRYRKAWKTQASSCQLAAMLTEIEAIQHRLTSESPPTEAGKSASVQPSPGLIRTT